MNETLIQHVAIRPSLQLLPQRMHSGQAIVMLLAIGLQESAFIHRHQIGGPAHGWWQFENGGGVKGVMTHPATQETAASAIAALGYPAERDVVFDALEHCDTLAAVFARLNLWWLPQALPAFDDPDEGWRQYLEAWRPGKPRPDAWAGNWRRARAAYPAM